MAVAFDATSEAAALSEDEGSFTWNHTPAGTPTAVVVFTFVEEDEETATSVTYGGVTVTAVAGASAFDSSGEPGNCKAWLLGSGVPTGTQAVVVNRTNNGNNMYGIAVTLTATGTVEATGVSVLEGDGTLDEVSTDDGSPGTNSLRLAAIASGLASIVTNPTTPGSNNLSNGASSTWLHSIDTGQRVAGAVRETTAGQGSRAVGFRATTSDDRAAVFLAVREVAASGPAGVKTMAGVAKANVKTVNGVAIANVKSINGIT